MFMRFVYLCSLVGLAIRAAPSSVLSTSFSSAAGPTSSAIPSTSFFTPSASVPTTTVAPSTSTALQTGPEENPLPSSVSFPPIGSIPRNYTPELLEELWNLVGRVASPQSDMELKIDIGWFCRATALHYNRSTE